MKNLFLPILALAACFRVSGMHEIYVSTDGADANEGTRSKPVLTLHRAAEMAAEIQGEVAVMVDEGIYYLGDTLKFGAEHSGVRFVGRNAVLSGGRRLGKLKFKPCRGGIFCAEVSLPGGIDQLFINGRRQAMARFPNRVPGKNVYDAWRLRHGSQTPEPGMETLAPERIRRWKNPAGGYLHAMHNALWGDMHWRIEGKDSKGKLRLTGGYQNNRSAPMHPVYRMAENIFEELDAPGEWFYDHKASLLYVYPEPGVDLDSAVLETVELRHLAEIRGTAERPVRNFSMEGFSFRHAARTFMDNREPLLRSDWTLYRGAAVILENTDGVALKRCNFTNLGGNALLLTRRNRNFTLRSSLFEEIGANGVVFAGGAEAVRSPLFNYSAPFDYAKIDRTPGPRSDAYPSDSLVEDCLFRRTGRDEKQTAPVQIAMARNITIRHCTVYDVPRAGINIGDGCWGGHVIEYCDVFNTVLETGDHGSFNSWGRDRFWTPGLQNINRAVAADPSLPFADAVAVNVIRNSRWSCDYGWGIDLDDGSGNYEIYNNLILKGGLKLREGYRRIVRNNLIVNNSLHPHCWLADSGDIFSGNLVMGAYRPALMGKDWGKQVDYNLFASSQEDRDQFRRQGCDLHSIVFTPRFRNPGNGDYTVLNLPPDSSYRNFPMNRFGVYSPDLKALAASPFFPVPVQAGKAETTPGKTLKQWRGLTVRDMPETEFSAFGVPAGTRGIHVVKAVFPLRDGDLIVGIGAEPAAVAAKLPEGEKRLSLKVVRCQKEIEILFP